MFYDIFQAWYKSKDNVKYNTSLHCVLHCKCISKIDLLLIALLSFDTHATYLKSPTLPNVNIAYENKAAVSPSGVDKKDKCIYLLTVGC